MRVVCLYYCQILLTAIFGRLLSSHCYVVSAASKKAEDSSSWSARRAIPDTMMTDIQQTMALSMFIYQFVDLRSKVSDKTITLAPGYNITLPRTAADLLRAGKCTYGLNQTRCFHEQPQKSDDEGDAVASPTVDIVSSTILDSKLLMTTNTTDDSMIDHVDTLSYVMDTMSGYERQILKSMIVHSMFDTKDAITKSRVYGIAIDHTKHRIIVAFRGSSSNSDWFRNIDVGFKYFPNPTDQEKPKKVGVHSGFYDALLGNDEQQSCGGMNDENSNTTMSTMETEFACVAQVVKHLNLFQQGYRLYVTGHSLGGAMATLFGFLMASSDDSEFTQNGSVVVYSYASPRVGNRDFRKAFEYLELSGKIKHARFRNERDVVPFAPYMFGRYKHVGLEIILRDVKSEDESSTTKNAPIFDYTNPTQKKPLVEQTQSMASSTRTGLFDRLRLRDPRDAHSTQLMYQRILSWRNEYFDSTTLVETYQQFLPLSSETNTNEENEEL